MILKAIKNKFLVRFHFLFCFSLATSLPTASWAIGTPSYVSTTSGKNFFTLSASGKSNPLFINTSDFPGVIRALKDLQSDINKVTNHKPELVFNKLPTNKQVVIVGTYGKNLIIDELVKNKKIDVKDIVGKWDES